jgi:hypothetical protein
MLEAPTLSTAALRVRSQIFDEKVNTHSQKIYKALNRKWTGNLEKWRISEEIGN